MYLVLLPSFLKFVVKHVTFLSFVWCFFSLSINSVVAQTGGTPPIANIISPSTACAKNISISAQDAGVGATYQWDFGLTSIPAIATGVGPHNITTSTCGLTVKLTVTQNGLSNTTTKIILGDTQAPTLIGVPGDITVEELPPMATVTATDNCTKPADITIDFKEPYVIDGCKRIGTCVWTATDQCGNSSTGSMKLTVNTILTLVAEVNSNYFPYTPYPSSAGNNVSKNGAKDGIATAIVVSGGTPPYTYLWPSGEATATATQLAAGTNIVTVTDTKGCKGTKKVVMRAPAKLGDYIFVDNNADGIQNVGDLPFAGVKVTLTGIDAFGASITMNTVSDQTGKYCFDGLIAGTYKLKFEIPNGNLSSPTGRDKGIDDNADSDIGLDGQTSNITINEGQSNLTIDAGFILPAKGKIGDCVWLDRNGNGVQDAADTTGVANIQVYLSGPVTKNTVTNAKGKYLFTDLPAGTYTLTFIYPGGLYISPQNVGTNDNIDSDANPTNGVISNIVLAPNQEDLSNDVGIYKLATLGNYVWDDKNKNGIQETIEPGISNVTVKLDGTPNDGSLFNQLLTATDANGIYNFYNLKPGAYRITFVKPIGYTASPANQGGDNQKDSDANINTGQTGNINLSSGANNNSFDAGFYKNEVHTCVVGDYVWLDCNKNGIQDIGEAGVPNVLVQLKNGTQIVAATTTAVSGAYSFNAVPSGTYTICFVAPSGFGFAPKDQGINDAIDSDARLNGSTDAFTITNQPVLTIDAGLTDSQAPIFINVPNNVTLECGTIIPSRDSYGITASDNYGTNIIVISKETIPPTNNTCHYKIVRTWTARDFCGNKTVHTQVVTIQDTKAPIVAAPTDLTINCGQTIPAIVNPTAKDNCDFSPKVILVSENTTTQIGKTLTKRVWQAIDRCGNSTQATQTICQVDTTPPTFVNAPKDITVDCSGIPPHENPQTNDNCGGGNVQVKYKETGTYGDCKTTIYILKREWTACDAVGNSSVTTQIITVQDNIPPTIVGVPADVTIKCGEAMPIMPNVTVTDNCDNLAKASFSELIFPGSCQAIVGGQPVVTNYVRCQWLATDQCGNSTLKVWNIYIVSGGGTGSIVQQTKMENNLIPSLVPKDNNELITEKTESAIKVYPNPSYGKLNVDIGNQVATQIAIMDLSGKVIYFDESQKSGILQINLEDTPKGIYNLRVKNSDGKWLHQKITLMD